jgi:hypothetical protein
VVYLYLDQLSNWGKRQRTLRAVSSSET